MTTLLFGSNGQVGRELLSTLPKLGELVALNYPGGDFTAPNSLREIVRSHRPSLIVNAAAYTAVDKAEAEPEKAFAVNAAAPAVLAEEAEAVGAAFVHYSTDYVFDGKKPTPYVETDATAPLSVYGRSKRDGEIAASRCRKHLIFRTSWVFAAHGHNFIKTILRLAKERRDLRVVADQIGAPTSAALLADVTTKILAMPVSCGRTPERWGLYHLAPSGETSWHGLACHVVARACASGLSLQATPATIAPITTAEYPTPAQRPANSRLATTKLRENFGLSLPEWTTGVNTVVDRLVEDARQ